MATYISIFSGAGGLDIGLELAGWDCLYATDIDPYAIDTLNANKGRRVRGVPVLGGALIEQHDIRRLSGRDVLRKLGRARGEVALLAGGPPCQSWSSAGHQLGFEDPRGRLFEDYLRVAKELDVRWLLFENVRGLITARGPDGRPGSALAAIRSDLLKAGWQTRVDLLNAADFGVPQRRVRVVLTGYREGDAPPAPSATHSESAEARTAKWVTLGDCLSKLRPPSTDEIIRPSGKLQLELANVPAGSGVKSPGKREATRPGGHWGYKQGAFVADLGRPARTVTASGQQDWIRDPKLALRRLSPRECAAIQTFPSEWVFCGGRSDQYRLIGNAVPPLLAQRIGETVLDHLATAVKGDAPIHTNELAPLPQKLQAAIEYTLREEARNGESRRAAPPRRARKAA